MSPFGTGAGAGLLSAPATLPRRSRAVEDELVDLLCDDPAWLRETFEEIVARNWAEPPPPRPRRTADRPDRHHGPRRGLGTAAVARSQRVPRPHSRQRSPPRRGV